MRDGVFHNGSKYLKVPPVEHQLNVKLATDKPQYLPGQTAEYSIDVTDADGKPAPRADLSLGVVDEAIYGIRRDTTEDILTFFYGHDYNRVYTDSSLAILFQRRGGQAAHASGRAAAAFAAGAAEAGAAGASRRSGRRFRIPRSGPPT